MRTNLLATGALLLLPWLPLACSASGDTSDDPFPVRKGGKAGAGGEMGSAGTGVGGSGVGGSGVGGSGVGGSGVGGSGVGGSGVGGSGVGGSGVGGGGGMGGGGGVGNEGGMAGQGGTGVGGTDGSGGSGGSDGSGGSGPTTADPVIPPVNGPCPTDTEWNGTFRSGSRTMRLVAGTKPPGPTAPMVFYWHGTGSTSGEYAGHAPIVNGVRGEGGVIVAMQGGAGGDLLSGTNIFGANDFTITDQLVACAVKDRNVDPRRIHATGCSAGGLFSAAMAARRSNYMASVAPNSGGWVAPVTWQNGWTPALMTMHGAEGRDVVIVDFAQTSERADNAFKGRGGFVINCDHGGGHCGLPGGYDAAAWEFFKAHRYGTKPSPWSSLPSSFPTACKIF